MSVFQVVEKKGVQEMGRWSFDPLMDGGHGGRDAHRKMFQRGNCI